MTKHISGDGQETNREVVQQWCNLLGPPVVPFYTFLGEGSPTKVDYRQKGTLILASLLEELALLNGQLPSQQKVSCLHASHEAWKGLGSFT